MDIFRKIAERKIQEALENGDLTKLSNAGKPLKLEDDTFIPVELRVCYKILKNAGSIPPELDLRNDIISLRSLINTIDDDKERLRKIRELNYKILKLSELRNKPFNIEDFPEYEERIHLKFF